VRPDYDHLANATVTSAPCAGRLSGRPGAAASRPGVILHFHRLGVVLLRAVLRTRVVRPDRRRRAPPPAGPAPGLHGPPPGPGPPGPGGAPRLRPPHQRDCHPRRRVPAAGAAGPALLLHARGRSCTPTGSVPRSCGPSSASGLRALIFGGAPSSAGSAPGLRGPPSGPGGAPRIRPPRRRNCHLRRRAPAAGAAGLVLLLRAWGRSCTSIGSASCSCGPSSASGLCALTVGGVPPFAGPDAGRRPGRAVRPDAGRRPGRAVRLEYDLVVAVKPAVGRLQTGRCGAPTRILAGAAVGAGLGRLHRHLRRRASAAPALLLHARKRSRTPTGSAPCSCSLRPPSAPGLCALIVGGAPSSAAPAPGLRWPPSEPGGAP